MNHKGTKDTKEHKERADEVSKGIIGAAIEVHRTLGPGLLESVYEASLAHELGLQGIEYRKQVALPLEYKGLRLDVGYRVDLLVADLVGRNQEARQWLIPFFVSFVSLW